MAVDEAGMQELRKLTPLGTLSFPAFLPSWFKTAHCQGDLGGATASLAAATLRWEICGFFERVRATTGADRSLQLDPEMGRIRIDPTAP